MCWCFFIGIGINANATLESRLGGLHKSAGYVYAWAVHSGDVGAASVPEPGTIALMGLGLSGLLGLGRHQRRR
ncbi:MAG TPA: hypothetical protein DEF07_05400 [Nitrosomonas sp.]|nr:hypothetical protein [Nitrosomonas sp.]